MTDRGRCRWKPALLALAWLIIGVGTANAQTDGGEARIADVSSDGYLVLMADNSVWLVEGYYLAATSVWLPTDNVVYASGNDRCLSTRAMLLVNVDEHNTACAVRVH
jgi:hypothetical protein